MEMKPVIDHVFLPPQLPQTEDVDSDVKLLRIAVEAVTELEKVANFAPIAIQNAASMLSALSSVTKDTNWVDSATLRSTLVGLTSGRSIAVHVAAQNAAVFITRHEHQLVFEQFELSPDNKAVYASPGRLVRTFPASAIAIDAAKLHQDDFATMVANTLSTMASQEVPSMKPESRKAGRRHNEDRDSASPAIVSELFFGMLRGIGDSYEATTVSKNTREEVLWKNALRPWRRSSMWLLIRVALQLTITRSPDGSRDVHKNVMLFTMSRVLSSALHISLPSELYHIMNAKLDRRRQKLVRTTSLHASVATAVEKALQSSFAKISTRWASLQANDALKVHMDDLKSLDFEADTRVELRALDEYIRSISDRQISGSGSRFTPSTNLLRNDSSKLPPLPKDTTDEYSASNLRQFEDWVARHLQAWTKKCDITNAGKQLDDLMKEYRGLAQRLYRQSPEHLSAMILTIVELWIACDHIAVRNCALLADYDPDIPPEAFQNLLLPSLNQMHRLTTAESYLASRKGKLAPYLLFDIKSPQGFGARFFDSSESHQQLQRTIVSQAESAKRDKLAELTSVQNDYNRLDSLYRQASCEYKTTVIDDFCDPPETETVHVRSCKKCVYQRQRDALSIRVHEWPLPNDKIQAKVIVFELQPPDWFVHWRDTRLYMLNQVLKGKRQPTSLRSEYRLSSNDPHLTQKHFRAADNRIGLLSQNKPVVVTHYATLQDVPHLKEKQVCVPNGLCYSYYDSTTRNFVGDFVFDNTIPKSCTYTLPHNTSSLQRFLFRPASTPNGEPPNVVISSQDTCPSSMTLEEYKDLSSIPLGCHIQWSNINLQLAMSSVDFKKVETTLVFLQCIYQAGPSAPNSDVYREAHNAIKDEAMVSSILENLNLALSRIKQNWESVQALSALVAIAARVLTLNSTVKASYLAFLKAARAVAVDWINTLRDKAHEVTDHADRSDLVSRSVEVALVCASTFDVDGDHLGTILRSSEDVKTLVWASIVVQEGNHVTSTSEAHVAVLALRFKMILHRGYHLLVQNEGGIDDAVSMAWAAYAPSAKGWSSVSTAADHWITTDVAAASHSKAAQVHLNLLTGELLVNGLPLDQPPASYREHPRFKTLFGHALVEVMPASRPGFQFSTKRSFGGGQVQLGMKDGELLVYTSGQAGTFETVPSKVLQTKYPIHFSDDFVLWYDLGKDVVELRPATDPWNSQSALKWTLSQRNRNIARWTLTKDRTSVVGTGRLTSNLLSQIIGPLAREPRIHCILQSSHDLLHVEVPSLRLRFALSKNSTDLRSLEYRSMSVDHDQSLGTLIGFANKLVLKSQQGSDRTVLVLAAPLSYSKNKDHVSVTASTTSDAKVYAIGVDEQLKRMIRTNDLDCKLYMAYLHALTSFCLPDPLTLKTGTEEALDILRSKGVASFEQLSQPSIDVLHAISQLSPSRRHYPAQEQVMQQTEWDSNLGFLSQHSEFEVVVASLFCQSQSTNVFYPDHDVNFPCLNSTVDALRKRDSIRSSTFRVAGYGADSHTTLYDVPYSGRDQGINSAQRVSTVAALVTRETTDHHWAAASQTHLWSLMKDHAKIQGVNTSVEISRMRYDAGLLGSSFAVTMLPALQRWLGAQISRQHTFSIVMWLATLAFEQDADIILLQFLVSCFKTSELAAICAPDIVSFAPTQGYAIVKQKLRDALVASRRDFNQSPESRWERIKNEKSKDYSNRRHTGWNRSCEAIIPQLVADLLSQWPSQCASVPVIANASTYFDLNKAISTINKHFQATYRNFLLRGYLMEIEKAMAPTPHRAVHLPPLLSLRPPVLVPSEKGFISEIDAFSAIVAPTLPHSPTVLLVSDRPPTRATAQSKPEPRLKGMIQRLNTVAGQSSYELVYASDLKDSLQSLVSRDDPSGPTAVEISRDTLLKYVGRCELYTEQVYDSVVTTLRSLPNAAGAASILHCPRLCPVLLLKQLARDRWSDLSNEWQRCVVTYGLALTALQRAKRLLKLSDPSRKEDFLKELRNSGHTNWDPMNYPETLLMEVESGFIVREVQEQIAREMRQPTLKGNEVLQLNMGEGKSSVIVPMAAANLADGSQLVRVLVAKPQSKQMAQMLISKVGGLVNRRVYYMPFSRSLPLTTPIVESVSAMVRECKDTGGILLVQPEHILSFKLMGLGCYIDGMEDVGRRLVSTQDFFDRSSRDIVDESDENFSTRFELIYTMGTQRSIELSPDRWFLVQEVLGILRTVAPAIDKELPGSIEIISGVEGSCPRIRLLRPDAGPLLIRRVAEVICYHGVDGFHLSRHSGHVRGFVNKYITESSLAAEDLDAVENSPVWTEATRSHLLMLRGLLAEGVLVFALSQKRWRVNYGLTTNRTPPTALAVPYRAKDSPSPRSEFSHPDVVITLTSLAYYYGGLSDDDLFAALSHLADSDEADTEYQRWVKDSYNLPTAFKQLQSINLKDRSQCVNELFPCLRYGKSVVDFFLSHLVFPKQMKEFPHKLSASGWDIGQQRHGITTGFSGTIDSRLLLPTDVQHLDVPEQKHTNALVLEYLLMPENGVHLMSSADQASSEAQHLLSAVMQLYPPVQVILDVGAQILELANLEMAKAWLALHDDSKEAAVFVDDSDEICVVDRNSRVEILRTSSYQSRLDRCLIFLDESHTRGIDLQLPVSYRAVVTLGPKLTKDRLVQACMRMRKLGQGQTVVFCIPEEIQAKVWDANPSSSAREVKIEIADVLIWAIGETHDELRRSMPLWAVQGERFVRQVELWQEVQDETGGTTMTAQHASSFLEDEAQTLQDRYLPQRAHARLSQLKSKDDSRCQEILKSCRVVDGLRFDASTLQEEQERELSPEIEQESQVQRAPPAKPMKHKLHPDVEKFAMTGQLVAGSQAYKPAFSTLKDTTAGEHFAVGHFRGNGRLLATTDFSETVQRGGGASFRSDAFLRSVQWILTSCQQDSSVIDYLMVISPYEANMLFPRMSKSKGATLHVYKPRVNSGYAPLDALKFQTIPVRDPAPPVPRQLASQLNVFAGQLYMTSYEDYVETCSFLGLSPKALSKEMEAQGWKVSADGFILSDEDGRVGGSSGLNKSPVSFLKSLMTNRRNGDGIAKTHVGRMLAGKMFGESEFQD
ncbi:hypothetical protein M409DRAFT_51492 [Zasmidium cellare ATCC 36951]|uniref:ubiquitinyl hydrolase 1 n=1 Tax=Zasmidium cellare ATCC 36951 TaxID=1080233 RepID=A0A6A6CX76_ZASCE|nr:uncharacterized protein M409DRAFT_51492 [Zasmidium cellare ATCC 36951]KAF2170452.1 hypothetical protein M409DRAFT_51492 [Zasmidium cellare ATCC 36951]